MRLLNHLRVSGALLNSYGNSVQCCLAIARLSVCPFVTRWYCA